MSPTTNMPEKISTAAEDRLSALPDDLLHHILASLHSPKLAAKATVLSKRWAHLWSTYPVLEFDEKKFIWEKSVQSFAAAASKKFSTGFPLAAIDIVRINSYGWTWWVKYLSHLFESVAKTSSPRELEIIGYIDIAQRCLFLQPFSRRLVSLKLEKGKLPKDAGGLFAGAPLLETLSLTLLCFADGRLQVRNLPNLKALKIVDCYVEELKVFDNDRLQEVKFSLSESFRSTAIEIDAPSLSKFCYRPNPNFFSKITLRKYGTRKPPFATVMIDWYILGGRGSDKLKEFVRKLSEQFRLELLMVVLNFEEGYGDDDSSSAVTIKQVNIPRYFLNDVHVSDRRKDLFLTFLFASLHPKLLSLPCGPILYENNDIVFANKYMWNFFVKKGSTDGCRMECKCWRHHLKDVKMLKRSTIMGDEVDEVISDISKLELSSLTEEDQVSFILTWH